MEPDRITLIDCQMNEVISQITDAGFQGSTNENAYARLAELSDERVRLTEPTLEEYY